MPPDKTTSVPTNILNAMSDVTREAAKLFPKYGYRRDLDALHNALIKFKEVSMIKVKDKQ